MSGHAPGAYNRLRFNVGKFRFSLSGGMVVPQLPRVVWALGGGGARGLAHLGVLRVLEEEQIPVSGLVGNTSMGAWWPLLTPPGGWTTFPGWPPPLAAERLWDFRFPGWRSDQRGKGQRSPPFNEKEEAGGAQTPGLGGGHRSFDRYRGCF